jgi:hypothetical protein
MKALRFAVVCLIGGFSGAAQAGLITVDLGKSLQQTQVSPGGAMADTNDYFAARAFYQNTGDFDNATLTYPGPGSPAAMGNTPGTYTFLNGATAAGYYISQSSSYPTQAALDADYPFGSYTYGLTGGTSGPASSTINYSSDFYTANMPTLTAASFTGLQGANPSLPINVAFAPMQDNPGYAATAGASHYVFLDVYTSGFGADVYSTYTDQTASLTNFVIPASTLAPNTSYSVLLTFDDRIGTTDGNNVDQFQLFDTKTEVDFTTGAANVPEPASLGLVGIGIGLLAAARKRAR